MNASSKSKKKTKVQNQSKNELSGTVNLLQLGAVLLAAVSFWATAQGMKEYVFSQSWQAYAASLAIQGILLGLNFYLPNFLSKAPSIFTKILTIFLSIVVMFSSSWFSYVYIAGKAYENSWETESRLLVQNTYRQVLFDSSEYSKKCRNILANNLSSQINALYKTSKSFDEENTDNNIEINWQSERDLYVSNEITGDKMAVVISDMEKALVENASQEIRNQLATTLENVSSEFQNMLDSTETDLSTERKNLDIISEQLRSAQNAEEVDNQLVSELQTQSNITASTISELTAKQTNLKTAIDRIGYYRILFTRLEGGNNIQISSILQDIQKELVSSEPNIDNIENQSTILFDLLQQSSNLFENGANDSTAYSELLSQVSTLIYDIKDYALASSSSDKLEKTIENLSGDTVVSEEKKDSWKEEWQEKLDYLQSTISTIPDYTQNNKLDNLDYDKAEAMQQLDEMIRLYISDHNTAHQGLIYLKSPYRSLAVFSFILASFFDLSGFVVGLIIHILSKNKDDEKQDNHENDKKTDIDNDNTNDTQQKSITLAFLDDNENDEDDEDIIIEKLLNEYLFFTGDYEKVGNHYIYKAFENITLRDIVFDSFQQFAEGIYIKKNDAYLTLNEQNLIYAESPKKSSDGIYFDCYLSYENNMLMISKEKNSNYKFLSHISENIPVFLLEGDDIDVYTAKKLYKEKASSAVLALNEDGNAIASIYIKS